MVPRSRLRRMLIALSITGAALVVACSKDPVADGEDCSESSDCKSGLCVTYGPGEGYCGGRSCERPGAAGECDPGYVCVAGGGSGIFSSGTSTGCKPTCARCPPTTKCPSDAKPDDTKCSSR